jgi:hypothetical protein
MAAFTITRIQIGDYDAWRTLFDEDRPRIVESGVLDRFEDKHGPNVLVEADPPTS